MVDRARSRFRQLTDADTNAIADIKAAAEVMADALENAKKLDSEGARGREFSLAMTKLDECVMWGNKAVTG
jgi:hypothetical protein